MDSQRDALCVLDASQNACRHLLCAVWVGHSGEDHTRRLEDESSHSFASCCTDAQNLQRAGKVGNVPVTVHSGVPRAEQVRECAKKEKTLLVLDDLLVGISQQYLDALFTRGSHNWGVSVILVTQHLFNKELRVARTNSHYLLLMRNPAGALQIRTIATHLFPSRTAHFIEAYRDACAKNFGYLLMDMHPETPEEMRLRTNIYEQKQIVYMPK
ncbi:hypothetical protein niasHT_016558 [Heterodera trifolii]|uniref:Uncharacterized protein n=1 Tax=Heterodera trifolii TaxID=157864 RepID=A0ABD2LK76_9BILA